MRALCQLALDRNADAFEEIRPPTLVLTDTMIATGHLPKFADDAYHIERDDLWAIPTAEVPLTSLARDEILDEADLPMRLMAYTPCFRREAGSAGRDTRGLLRVHEFDKVELLAYATPDAGPGAARRDPRPGRGDRSPTLGLAYRVARHLHRRPRASRQHRIVRHRGLRARVRPVARGVLGVVVQRLPGPAGQHPLPARPSGKGTEVVHTLNGSALAVPRVWAALVETHRQPDGSIAIPATLHPYFRGATTISR